jgi:uncharacterized protein (DUF1499 family)
MTSTHHTTNDPARARGIGRSCAWAGIALAIACAAAELLAGPGYRLGWWPLGTGLQTVRWSATVDLAAAALSLAAVVLALRNRERRTLSIGVIGLIVSVAVAAPPLMLWQRAQHLPRIHDVSTDTVNPPAFVAVLPLRRDARNGTGYSARTAAQQKSGYPDIVPLHLDMPPAQALQRAEQAARDMGWIIVDVSTVDLRIEATDTTLLFGFKDDVVIRITPQDSGSRVDVRSLSRVGGSDFGVNARRVRTFLKKLGGTSAAPS